MDIGTIFSGILFIGPGFLIRMLEDDLYPNSNRFDNSERNIIKAFIDSFFILIINLTLLKKIFKYNFFDFNYFVNKFETIDFFIKYVFLTFCICCIYTCIIKRFIKFSRLFVVNEINGESNVETPFPTIWDSIFNDYSYDFYEKVITIEKEGQLISCGYVEELPRINAETKELKLVDTKKVQKYMNQVKFKEHYIDIIEFEYFDFETGTLIKCYRLVKDAFKIYDNKEKKELQTNE